MTHQQPAPPPRPRSTGGTVLRVLGVLLALLVGLFLAGLVLIVASVQLS